MVQSFMHTHFFSLKPIFFRYKMAEEGSDLPYRAEYAKSGRAKCKGCKAEVPKGDCRLASMTQVFHF